MNNNACQMTFTIINTIIYYISLYIHNTHTYSMTFVMICNIHTNHSTNAYSMTLVMIHNIRTNAYPTILVMIHNIRNMISMNAYSIIVILIFTIISSLSTYFNDTYIIHSYNTHPMIVFESSISLI
jgi:hypothetical protein